VQTVYQELYRVWKTHLELTHLQRKGLPDVKRERGFLLDVMGPHVLLQGHRLRVAFTADLADEGTFAGV
jgi:hypothetical protein